MGVFTISNGRVLTFLIGCIGSRLLLAWAVFREYGGKSVLASITAVIGVGFLAVHYMGLRPTGAEVSGERIWWDHLRLVHGVLYLVAAANIMMGESLTAAEFLLADTVIGLGSFLETRIKI